MSVKDDPGDRVFSGVIAPIFFLIWVVVIALSGEIQFPRRGEPLKDPARVCGQGLVLFSLALHLFAWRFLANYDHLAERAHRLRLLAIFLGVAGGISYLIGEVIARR